MKLHLPLGEFPPRRKISGQLEFAEAFPPFLPFPPNLVWKTTNLSPDKKILGLREEGEEERGKRENCLFLVPGGYPGEKSNGSSYFYK